MKWVFLIAVVIYLLTAGPPTAFNEPVVLANQMLHGHLYLQEPMIQEHVTVKGYAYPLQPPLATLVALPSVAIWGLDADQTGICIIIAAVSVALVYGLTSNLWLTAFYGFGTTVWYETSQGQQWGFILILAATLTLAALYCRRWTGLWAALAALARYDLLLLFGVYALMKRKHVLYWAIVPIVGYGLYNWLRFHSFTDPTLWTWYEQDPLGKVLHPDLGPFSIHYLPYSLYTALFMAPKFINQFPWFQPTGNGQSLLTTSPALLLALRAPFRKLEVQILWLGVILSMAACLVVWSNGYVQFGARYWILALPFFVLLMNKTPMDQFAKLLIATSIVLTALGMYSIHSFGFA